MDDDFLLGAIKHGPQAFAPVNDSAAMHKARGSNCEGIYGVYIFDR